MPSIKDVAEAAGVSTATVSRVLSDKPHVRPELRAKVLAAVAELDYRPNLIARTLRSQRSTTIGLIVSDIRNPFFTSVSRAVEDTAYNEGYSVFLCNTDEDPQKEAFYLQSMQAELVAGIIFSPTRQSAERFAALDIRLPTVVVDRAVSDVDVDSVLIDNVDAAYRLTRHLIANGYRRIGALFGAASTTGMQRRRGFEAALAEAGLAPAAVVHIQPKADPAYQATKAMLADTPGLDAVFTSNSLLTAGALSALREAGVAIPDAVALVGFDETTWSTLVQPPITVIAQPTYEIGKTATELLIQRLQDPQRPPRQVILKGQLLARESSRAAAHVG